MCVGGFAPFRTDKPVLSVPEGTEVMPGGMRYHHREVWGYRKEKRSVPTGKIRLKESEKQQAVSVPSGYAADRSSYGRVFRVLRFHKRGFPA
jgi:hypothetical protein